MSRKSVLIAQLGEEEEEVIKEAIIKDAFRHFAARFANSKKIDFEAIFRHPSNTDSSSDSDSDGELCTCKCQRVAHKARVRDKSSDDRNRRPHKRDDYCNEEKKNIDCCVPSEVSDNDISNNIDKVENVNENNCKSNDDKCDNNDDNDEHLCDDNCCCISCEEIKSNENANKLIADEEKKKKRSEKKKAQKKKKRDKKKAEKKIVNEEKSRIIEKEKLADNYINSKTNNSSKDNKSKKKNNDADSNKLKSDNSNNKEDAKSAKQLNGGETDRLSLSSKSSPKSEREHDVNGSDAEEEELHFSSAYVSQIAQRKSKSSKTAQTQLEAQDYGHSDDHKNNVNYANNSNNNYNSNHINKNQHKEIVFGNEEITINTKVSDSKPKFAKGVIKENNVISSPNAEKSIELAILANQKAEALKFIEAIDLFTQALKYNPTDYRFYVNRSYCYDSIQDYRSALKDADIAIQMRSDWPKCHYRRGKALAGLKNYQEAEISLKRVIAIEKDCDEALTELWHVRYGAITDMGYDTSTANIYASQYDSIRAALEALSLKTDRNQKSDISHHNSRIVKNYNSWNTPLLLNGANKVSETWEDDDIYISDDEYNSVKYADSYLDDMSPTNPFGWKALWVGNVALNAKLDTITSMFRKFGNLSYCNIFKGNNGGNFILVHYDNPDSPRLAMTKYQGKIIPGVSITDSPLTIRFRPNKDQKKPNYDQRLESDECYYWRTTGCMRGEKCLYKHTAANKGVDKQAWMCNPLKKGLPYTNLKSQK